MVELIYKIFIILVLPFFLLLLPFKSINAYAQEDLNYGCPCLPGYDCIEGHCIIHSSAQEDQNSQEKDLGPGPQSFSVLEDIYENVLGLIIGFAGLAVFIMLLKGGFAFMTSAGDPQKTASAQATLTWAVVGLIVLFGIWFVLRLIAEFTGVEGILFFDIPEPQPYYQDSLPIPH